MHLASIKEPGQRSSESASAATRISRRTGSPPHAGRDRGGGPTGGVDELHRAPADQRQRRPLRAANNLARARYSSPARTTRRRPPRLTTTSARPRPRRTLVMVPSQRSVTVIDGRPLIARVRLAPPTARKPRPAVMVSERTTTPFGGPEA